MKNLFYYPQILIINLVIFFSSSLFGQELIHEEFDSGLVAPEGWNIKAGGVYTSASGSGSCPPSIKLSATGHCIETSNFSNATECSFLIKGYSIDSLSKLVIYYNTGDEWKTLDSIEHISRTKKILVFPLPADAQKLKFVYYKSKGNLAFDDLIVKNTNFNADTLPPVFINKTPRLTGFSDTSAVFSVSISKPGLVYYIITSEGCPVPGYTDFFNFNNYNGACIIDTGSFKVIFNTDTTFIIKTLQIGTNYVANWMTASLNNLVSAEKANAVCKFSLSKSVYDLFFSEIIKGKGSNKAIEIFNPSNDTIILKKYRIAASTNGAGWKTSYYNFPDNSSIAPHDAFVILNSKADTNIVDFKVADVLTTASVLGFTGNDARGLQKLDTLSNTWQFTDIFGDPGSSDTFDIAGIAKAAASHTLLRKSNIKHGNTNWVLSAGTNANNSEWIVKDLNDFGNLGIHQMQFELEQAFDTVYFDNQESPVIIDSINHMLTFILHSESDITTLKLHYSLPEGIIAEPDSSNTFNCTEAFKLTLSTTDKIYTTGWTITTLVDPAPAITSMRYDENGAGMLIVTFSEPVVTCRPFSFNCGPYIRLSEYGNSGKTINIEVNTDSTGKVLKIIPVTKLQTAFKYNLLIDSVYDAFSNPMPACEWSFLTPLPNSIHNLNNPKAIQAWPNPAPGFVNVILPPGFNNNNLIAQLVSMEGKIFYPRILKHTPQLSMSLSGINKGIYILHLINNGKRSAITIVHINE